METTTIRLKNTTKKLLDKLGSKGESYDEILNKLIILYKEKNE